MQRMASDVVLFMGGMEYAKLNLAKEATRIHQLKG